MVFSSVGVNSKRNGASSNNRAMPCKIYVAKLNRRVLTSEFDENLLYMGLISKKLL